MIECPIMIVVAEPTYADGEHAAVNAALLECFALARGPVLFAATPLNQACVREAANSTRCATVFQDITVLPPGGISLRRMWAQWKVLEGLSRAHAPRILILLSAGPETLYVIRALVGRYPALNVFAVMHGNLAEIVGWRSRDPRRRLVDLRSSLAVARHPRIRLVVLEPYIRDAAARAGLTHEFLVWLHPCASCERAPLAPWAPGPRLRVTFVGTANQAKGFEDFIALSRAVGPAFDWSLAGKLGPEYRSRDLRGIEQAAEPLSRAAFVERVRRADYAFLAFRSKYELIASGSLLDCITQRKPLIAIGSNLLAGFEQRYGPFGYLCPDLPAAEALLSEPGRLRDPAVYARFQCTLDSMYRDRVPAALAPTISRDLGC
jgi:hypothetical protein